MDETSLPYQVVIVALLAAAFAFLGLISREKMLEAHINFVSLRLVECKIRNKGLYVQEMIYNTSIYIDGHLVGR
jgi:hypothetical protein